MPRVVNKRSARDWLWPQRNPRYYFTDDDGADLGESGIRALLSGTVAPSEVLKQAQDVAQSAADRTAAAERRAGMLAGAVAIAASLTVGGAALVLDKTKIPDEAWRFGFALAFALATLMFVLAGLYAAHAVVTFRQWAWPYPDRVIERATHDPGEQCLERATEMLHGFAFNWEISDAKLRAVRSSLRAFTTALVLLVIIALGFAVYQLV